jgi:8-oxo-dGTP diphosphatase
VTPSDLERAQVAGLPRHVVGVAGVIVGRDGRALAVRRRSPQRWELPGGALESGEQILHGLRREVREEIGLEVEPVRLSGVYQNMALGPVAMVFLCRRTGGAERTSDETSDWRWVDRDEVATLMPPAWSVRFTDGLDLFSALAGGGDVPGPQVRAHDGTDLL